MKATIDGAVAELKVTLTRCGITSIDCIELQATEVFFETAMIFVVRVPLGTESCILRRVVVIEFCDYT